MAVQTKEEVRVMKLTGVLLCVALAGGMAWFFSQTVTVNDPLRQRTTIFSKPKGISPFSRLEKGELVQIGYAPSAWKGEVIRFGIITYKENTFFWMTAASELDNVDMIFSLVVIFEGGAFRVGAKAWPVFVLGSTWTQIQTPILPSFGDSDSNDEATKWILGRLGEIGFSSTR